MWHCTYHAHRLQACHRWWRITPSPPARRCHRYRASLELQTGCTLNPALVQVVGNAPKPPCQAATAVERLQAPYIQCMLAQSCHRWWGMPQCCLPGTALAALSAQLATNNACCPQPCCRWWGIPQSLLPGYCHCYPAPLALCIQCRAPIGLPQVVGNTPKPPARHCPYCCVVQAASANHNRSHTPGNITQRLQQVWRMPYPDAPCCQIKSLRVAWNKHASCCCCQPLAALLQYTWLHRRMPQPHFGQCPSPTTQPVEAAAGPLQATAAGSERRAHWGAAPLHFHECSDTSATPPNSNGRLL
jgi:hypothetical protein